jgi:hypothetical protein
MPDAGGRNLPRATALRIRLPVLYIENYETRNRPPFCAFVLTMIWLLIAILAAFAALAIASLAGRRRFRQRVTTEVAGLYSGPGPEIGSSQLCARLDSLPAPVRRYLRYTVSEGAPAIRTVRLKHEGHFRTGPKQRWLPIEGEQYFTVGKPGFVWHACTRLAPLIWIEARDCLLGGGRSSLPLSAAAASIAISPAFACRDTSRGVGNSKTESSTTSVSGSPRWSTTLRSDSANPVRPAEFVDASRSIAGTHRRPEVPRARDKPLPRSATRWAIHLPRIRTAASMPVCRSG